MIPIQYIKVYPLDRSMDKLWFVAYKLHGKKPQKKYGKLNMLHTLSDRLKEAQILVHQIRLELGIEQITEKVTVPRKEHDLIQQIENNFDIRSVYLRKKSISTYQSKVNVFVTWYRKHHDSLDVQKVGVGHAFVNYLKELNLSHTSINAYRNTIKEFWPKDRPNPFKETFKLPESRSSYRYFNEVQQLELYNTISDDYPQLWMAIMFQYYLLLRPNELRTLKVGQINLEDQKVKVLGMDSKNRKTQFVAIPNALIDQLAFLKNCPPYFYVFSKFNKPGLTPLSKKHFPDLHQKILKKLRYNTDIFKFYSWKHTGAVMYYLKTADIKGLKEQGRWHSMDMVNEYLKNLGVMDIERIITDFPSIGGDGGKLIQFAL